MILARNQSGAGSVSDESKRVLFVLNDPRFFVTHRLALARGVRDAGYDVHVAVPFDREFSAEIANHGFHTHVIAIERQGINPLRDLKTVWQLAQLYRKLQPSLVHHVTIKPVLYGTLAARATRVPAIVNAISGLGTLLTPRSRITRARSACIRATYRVVLSGRHMIAIFQNEHDRSTFLRAEIVDESSSVLIPGSGTQLDSFDPLSPPPSPPVVMLPARLIRQKGVEDFVKAARLIKAAGIAARFVLVGDAAGNRDAVPESDLARWVGEGIVEKWGWVNDIPRAMAQASIVCLPTYYGEGVPKALIDSCAAGRPIVATDVPGCRDVVIDGVNGILIQPRDPVALGTALRTLLLDAALRQRMGRAARSIAERKFDLALVVQLTLDAYNRVTAQ